MNDVFFTKSYVRDPNSNVLINNDDAQYNEYKFRSSVFKEIKDLKTQLTRVMRELKDTKDRLRALEESSNV